MLLKILRQKQNDDIHIQKNQWNNGWAPPKAHPPNRESHVQVVVSPEKTSRQHGELQVNAVSVSGSEKGILIEATKLLSK